MRAMELFNAGRASDQAEKLDLPRALRFQDRGGFTCAMTRGEHRIEHQNFGGGDVDRQAVEVTHGPQRFSVAVKSDVTDAGIGSDPQDSIQHAEAGTEDRKDRKSTR